VSIAKQFIITVEELDLQPHRIRSDRSGETMMMAEAQYALYLRRMELEQNHQIDERILPANQRLTFDEIADAHPLRDVYLFGTSTANTRIESLWNRLIIGQTERWLVYFK
jgi:hypothetical protein